MFSDGWTDSRRKPDNRFFDVCVVPDIVCFVIYSMEQGPYCGANRCSASLASSIPEAVPTSAT
jgi:hypothetical protein